MDVTKSLLLHTMYVCIELPTRMCLPDVHTHVCIYIHGLRNVKFLCLNLVTYVPMHAFTSYIILLIQDTCAYHYGYIHRYMCTTYIWMYYVYKHSQTFP